MVRDARLFRNAVDYGGGTIKAGDAQKAGAIAQSSLWAVENQPTCPQAIGTTDARIRSSSTDGSLGQGLSHI